MASDLLKQLADPQRLAVRALGSAWPGGFWGKSAVPAGWVVRVEAAEREAELVAEAQTPRAGADDRLTLVRRGRWRVSCSFADLRTQDGFDVSLAAQVDLAPRIADAELAALSRYLEAHQNALDFDGLRAALYDAAADALRSALHGCAAEALVTRSADAQVCDVIAESLQRFAFTTGLEVQSVRLVEVVSDDFARTSQRAAEAAAQRAKVGLRQELEAASLAAARQRLAGISEVLSSLEGLANQHESTEWKDLLPGLAIPQRGALLANLWRIRKTTQPTRAIVAALGQHLSWLDLQTGEETHRVDVPAEFGALRSVRWHASTDELLVGSARGVWRLNAADGSVLAAYPVATDATIRSGFNAATLGVDRLFATHSQLGCLSWDLSDPDAAPTVHYAPQQRGETIRAATANAEGTCLAYAIDATVRVIRGSGTQSPGDDSIGADSVGVGSVVHSLTWDRDALLVGTDDGTVYMIEHGAATAQQIHRSASAVESLTVRRWQDLCEIVVPAGASGVVGVFGDLGTSVGLMESPQPVSHVRAAEDGLVALNARRDALYVLQESDAGMQPRVLNLGAQHGTRIQDVTLRGTHETNAVSEDLA